MSGSSVRASEPASIHGRRCSGVAMTAPSLTIAIGLASWSTTTSALAWARSARLIASASGRLDGIGIARLASARACSAGSRSRTRADRSAWPALIHMKAAMAIEPEAVPPLASPNSPRATEQDDRYQRDAR